MSKSKKKLSRRFKRTIGFALAGLFLVSAIVVALIPQKDASAYTASSDTKTYLMDSENEIPEIDDTVDKIYTNGDGFQFAFKNKNNSPNKIAIICGYDYQRSLDQGKLEIPNNVDAYKKYTDSYGTSGGYVAVSLNDEFLFYPNYKKVIVQVDSGEVDEDGNPIMVDEEQLQLDGYLPCYYSTYNNWIVDEYGNDRNPQDFYFESSPGVFEQCIDKTHQRITNVDVTYIANQNVYSNPNDSGPDWLLGNPEDGIFSKANNIVDIKFGDKLLGIGNYAFKGCANVSSVTFNDGINTLGNYAFADCYNLNSVTLPLNSAITVIGQNTFANCQSLKTFNLPTGVTKIGDSCFEGCISLESCVLDAPDKQMSLNEMGKNVFKGCTSLQSIVYPALYNENQDVAWFEGCTSLKYITIPNANMKLIDSAAFTFEDFKNQVPEEFYLEGLKDKELHKISTANSFAFKYLNEEIYEKVTHEDNNPTNDKTKVVFRVNNANELVFFEMGQDVTIVNIPNKIGPYGITKIGSDSFANNCVIKKVTIPSNITEIEEGAFKGCHNLEDVIFNQPINVSYIGDGAFDTQTVGPACSHTLSASPVLTFTGEAKKGSAPFEYAMNADNNINNNEQPETYITFYTGWPSNLTVKYNSATKENELVEVPTSSNLTTLSSSSRPYMNGTYASAATSAYNMLNAGTVPNDNTPQNVKDIYNAVTTPVLPDGITSIKEGLFSGLDKEGNPITGMVPNTDIFSIEMNGVKKIDPYAFKDCDSLANVKVNDGLTALGDYAFESCDKLSNVEIYSDLNEFGKVPFLSCKNLNNDIVFKAGDNSPFECQDLIVYSKVNGVKTAILEVLGSRGNGQNGTTSNINPSVFATVNSVAEEAFKDCDGVTEVDFSQSNITSIPKGCFEGTDDLYKVVLRDGTTTIGPDAFKDSNIKIVEIPRSVSIIDNTAFSGDPQQITFKAELDSPAAYYAESYPNIVLEQIKPKYHVTFYDLLDPADPNSIDVNSPFAGPFTVEEGDNALDLLKKDPSKEGWIFVGWQDEYGLSNVTKDINTRAIYRQEDPEEIIYYTVRFIDTFDNSEYLKETVEKGKDCELIKLKGAPDHLKDGYKFEGWLGDINNVTENRTIYTQYETFDITAEYTVTFLDWDDTVLYTQKVKAGEDCIDPKDPTREGYKFTGWRPSIKAITKDTTVYAQYEKIDATNPDDKKDDNNGGNKDNENKDGDNKNGDNNGNNNNTGNNNNGNNNNSNTPTLYTVTVVDGTGSGSYVQGANVIILANNAPSGKVFDKWVVDEGVNLVKAELAANYFVMPAKNVTLKATYKDDTSNKNNNGNNNNGNNNSNTSTAVKPNTTVSLTKGGFSNNGIASASVVGSSDNYVLKITDSQTAKAEVEDALLSKYDSLDNIKYVAMDISLYDATGSAKIENTSDLKVSVTLPIPDDLVPYAGNNRVAYVINGKLIELNPKFTTINGVPCINFVAPHFSPYTIYVDTTNLTSSVSYTPTSTPKTGDGLSVKWYISIALFAASIIFFALCIPSGKKRKVSGR